MDESGIATPASRPGLYKWVDICWIIADVSIRLSHKRIKKYNSTALHNTIQGVCRFPESYYHELRWIKKRNVP